VAARELVVLGTASRAPTRTRNHNGYFLRWDALGVLFDPGEGTQRQMLLAGVTASSIGAICVTHFHGDHCLGLPGVLQRMAVDQVMQAVEVCYPAATGEHFARLRHAALFRDSLLLMEHPVPEGGMAIEIGDVTLQARPLSHPVPTFGYRLAEPDGRRMRPDLLVAHGISGPDIGRVQKMGKIVHNGKVVSLADVSESRAGQKFAFIMDTRLCDAAFELAADADMLVCEATFLSSDAALADDYGHLTAGQAGRIAADAGARLLVLTHFSQRYGDDDMARFAAEAAGAFGGEIVVARDLDRVPVPRRPRLLGIAPS
jgi:ribonuclease Z